MSLRAPLAPRAPLAIGIAGPTACGKSALALAFARRHARVQAVEIVSVDSAQVYRGMDIGTAKPSVAERAEVPHHLIDIRDPTETYSAAQFAVDARRLVGEIRARGALPLLVGGTMLYFKALREGLDRLPATDPATRRALDAEAAERGWPALHAGLARVDPATAARLAPHDAQRIQRALEVWRLSGRPLSAWQSGPRAADAEAWPLLTLEPASRAWLHARIGARFERMVADGLLDEVRRLRERGDLHAQLPSMRCVGYRQAWQALEAGECGARGAHGEPGARGGSGGAGERDAWVDAGIAATRRLAKRQLTWLRSIAAREVVACDAPDAMAAGLAVLARLAASMAPDRDHDRTPSAPGAAARSPRPP